MRYCINCGRPIGDERFCNQCGADNGAAEKNTEGQINAGAGAVDLSKVDLSFIVHIVSVSAFVIAALVLFVSCCKQAEIIAVQSMLYTGTAVFSVFYFAIGMWSCVPALQFLLNIKKNRSSSVAGAAIVMIIIMIAVCFTNVIFARSNGFMKIFSIMTAAYKSKITAVFILEFLSAAAGIMAPKMTK